MARIKRSYQCSQCDEQFATMTRLVVHRTEAHPLSAEETEAIFDRFERGER